MTTEGIEFINAKPRDVIEYLKGRNVWQTDVSPAELLIKNSGRFLSLKFTGRDGGEYPVRRSFLHKLLRWYSFPVHQLKRLSAESTASICNDFLLHIRREYLTVKFEGEEALTITSPGYTEITDLEIIEKLSGMKLRGISRNDFMLRVTSEEKFKAEPVPGDDFGIGICIINSETGFRALSVSHFLWRYVCSNGAVVKIDNGDYRKIHYGYQREELTDFIDGQIALANTGRDRLTGSISALADQRAVDHGPRIYKMQSALGKDKVELTEQLSLFDYFNEVTERAKKYDLSKRSYLEELAGALVY